MFKVALTAVIKDDSFIISARGQRAHLCASKLLEWGQESADNTKFIAEFAVWLIDKLKSCLTYPTQKGKYHTCTKGTYMGELLQTSSCGGI